jgi:hypothetical protein
MKKRPKTKAQLFAEYSSGKDFRKAAEKAMRTGEVVAIRETGSSHFVVIFADGSEQSVPNHQEIATGTRWAILKSFMAAGVITLGVILLIYLAAQSFSLANAILGA